jgi:fibronectin-binding autotransporter adhesin
MLRQIMRRRPGYAVAGLRIAAGLLVSLLAVGTSQATSYTWSGATSNAWNLDTNWGQVSGSGLFPGSGTAYADTAVIGTVITNTPVSLSTTATLGGGATVLTLSNVAGSAIGLDITASGLLGVQGNIVLSSGATNGRKITLEGILRNDAASSATTYTISGGTNAGDIIQLAGGTISSLSGGKWTFSRPVQGYGTISSVFAGTVLANVPGATLHITNPAESISASSLTNSGGILSLEGIGVTGGTLNVTGGGLTRLVGGTFTGTINASAGEVDINGTTLNSLSNVSGNVQLTGDSAANTAGITSLVFNGHKLDVTGTITNYGSIHVDAGTLNNAATSGTTLVGNSNFLYLTGGSITNAGGSTLVLGTNISGYGSVAGVTSQTYAFIANGGTLTLDGGAGIALGTHSGSGVTMQANAAGILDLKGALNVINPGLIYPTTGAVAFDGVTISTYDPTGGVGGTPTTWNETVNTGAVNVINDSTLIGKFTSSANVTIQSGKTLHINDSAPSSGTTNLNSAGSILGGNVAVASNATLTSSGVLQLDGLSGGGTLAITGSSSAFTLKGAAWPTNAGAVQNIGMLTVGGAGLLDVMNNLVNVNYGAAASPYSALAAQVNSGVIAQSTTTPYRAVGLYDTATNLDGTTPGGTTVRLGYASPGDTMLRGHVDSSDILNILSAGKYGIGPSSARWDQGDFTHDGQVDSSDILDLLAAGTYNTGVSYNVEVAAPKLLVVGGSPSSSRATIIYNPVTGDVEIDPNGNTMTGFRLLDSAGSFFGASAAFPPGGAFTTDTGMEKFWSTFSSSSYLTSVFDLGLIAPTGLTDAQFEAALNNLSGDSVWTAAGGGSFDYNFSSTPEPATMTLLILGGFGVYASRKRRR